MDRIALIKYIRENDKSYKNHDFLQYSDSELVLIKIRIELEVEEKKLRDKPGKND